MKSKIKVFLSLILLTSISFLCSAQLAMTLKMSRTHYLQYETIHAKVTIRNNSGHAVVFGDNKRLQGKLLFKIISRQRIPRGKIKDASFPMSGVIIKPGQHKDFIVPISNFYKLRQCGTFRIYAYVEHNMFEDNYMSNETSFEINKGFTIWKQVVGVPEFMLSKKKQQIKNRTYRLAGLLSGRTRSYYLVIENKTRVFGVLYLGDALGEEKITHEVDALSNLHLMIPISPKIFVHLVVDVNGRLEDESVYKRTTTVPALVRNPKTGKIYVIGGSHAKKKRDYR